VASLAGGLIGADSEQTEEQPQTQEEQQTAQPQQQVEKKAKVPKQKKGMLADIGNDYYKSRFEQLQSGQVQNDPMLQQAANYVQAGGQIDSPDDLRMFHEKLISIRHPSVTGGAQMAPKQAPQQQAARATPNLQRLVDLLQNFPERGL